MLRRRSYKNFGAEKIAGCAAAMLAASLCLLFGSGTAAKAAGGKTVAINEANFPDPVFRGVISGSDYDRDGNGVLDQEEIGLTINIRCEGMGVRSVKGVEYFTDLQGLWCKNNKIEKLDLGKNKELRGLWCSGNLLTELDLSQNPELLWVYCYDCRISTLNVADNPKMAFIECNTNPLKSLDVSHNPELEHLTCGSCGLKELDVTHNPKLAHLDAFKNNLKKLDVTHNPKMKRLDIWYNRELGSIDISANPGLQYYNCAYNKADSVDVSHNPELNKLICSYNEIQTLDLSHNPKLVYLDCACNQIGKLNLKENPKLRFLQAFTNPFRTLDIGYNPYLIKTYKEGKKKSESAVCRGHSWTINYGGDDSTGGDQLFFLCFDDAVKLKAKAAGGKENAAELDDDVTEADTDYVTREMMAVILYEMAGSPSVTGLKSRFTDVESGSWYEKALLWGEKHHICTGYPEISSDTFGVGKWITRQDVALMLMRYSELMQYERSIDFGRSDDYIDYYEIDFDHWEAICWTATWNLMDGKGAAGAPKEEQRIDPLGKATRAEVKETIKRMLAKNEKPTGSFLQIFQKVVSNAPAQYVATDEKTGTVYRVTAESGKKTAAFLQPSGQSLEKIEVPNTVVLGGKKLKVTKIAPNAFRDRKKLKQVTIGKNIRVIGQYAFYGCKNLKKITIKTKKLKKKTVGKGAFQKIHKKAVFKVPKNKKSAYDSILKRVAKRYTITA